MAPEKWAGEKDRVVEFDGLSFQKDAKIGCEAFCFLPEKVLLPEASGSSVIVISRDR
jgi:hypothetical protein